MALYYYYLFFLGGVHRIDKRKLSQRLTRYKRTESFTSVVFGLRHILHVTYSTMYLRRRDSMYLGTYCANQFEQREEGEDIGKKMGGACTGSGRGPLFVGWGRIDPNAFAAPFFVCPYSLRCPPCTRTLPRMTRRWLPSMEPSVPSSAMKKWNTCSGGRRNDLQMSWNRMEATAE